MIYHVQAHKIIQMAEATFYIDTASFSTATAVFTNASLTTKAADGYYSDESIVRQQVNGILEPAVNCGNCASPPPTPAQFCITQNVDNQITGGTEGVDYDLFGDTTNPTVKCGPTGALISFNITATAKNNKRFKTSNPFRATNPSVVVGSSNQTVTNTLTGELEEIVAPPPTTVFIFLGACFKNSFFEQNNAGDDGVYLQISQSEYNALSNGQRYAISVPNSYQSDSYLFYNSADTRNNPVKTDISSLDHPLANSSSSSYIVSKLSGEFNCPIQDELIYVLVEDCSGQATGVHYFAINRSDYDALGRPSKGRYIDNSNVIWAATGQGYSQPSGTEKTDLVPVDIAGVRKGVPGFRGQASGCPSTYYKLRRCGSDDVYTTIYPIEFYPSVQSVNAFAVLNKGGYCYEVIGTINELEYRSFNRIALTDDAFYAEGGCDNCQ